jgi:hypothetical protein
MVDFANTDELENATFSRVSLRGARFASCDLSDARIRGSDAQRLELDIRDIEDAPLYVNGVDVVPLVDAELNRRFPGRELRMAESIDDLRRGWSAVSTAWESLLDRAASMPEGSIDASVEGEWSFAQTVRHLILATNAWLHGGIAGVPQPFHPYGQVFDGYAQHGGDMSLFSEPPSYEALLAVRAEHQEMVRDYLAAASDETLAETCANPWDSEHVITKLTCIRVILIEEWEHLRFATRDLDALEA